MSPDCVIATTVQPLSLLFDLDRTQLLFKHSHYVRRRADTVESEGGCSNQIALGDVMAS